MVVAADVLMVAVASSFDLMIDTTTIMMLVVAVDILFELADASVEIDAVAAVAAFVVAAFVVEVEEEAVMTIQQHFHEIEIAAASAVAAEFELAKHYY